MNLLPPKRDDITLELYHSANAPIAQKHSILQFLLYTSDCPTFVSKNHVQLASQTGQLASSPFDGVRLSIDQFTTRLAKNRSFA